MESIRQRKDGTLISVSVLASPIIVGDEQVAFYSIYRDITERKRAENAIRQSEERYRTLFSDSIDAILLAGPDGKIIDCNQAALDMWGYSKDEMMHLEASHLYADPADRVKFKLAIEKTGSVKDFEIKYRKKDGTIMECLESSTLRVAEDGSVFGYMGIMRDVTEKKRIEAELLRTSNFLQNVLDSSIDGITVTDLRGKIISFTPKTSEMLGFEQEEVMGKEVYFLYGKGKDDAKAIMRELSAKGELRNHEMQLIKKGGELIDINTSASLIRDEKGEVIGTLGVFRDITERKLMFEELRQAKDEAEAASSAKTDFLATMSHEIRTPMNAIIGMADLLRETPLTPEQQQYVQVFSSAGENLLNVINDILDISKVEAGHLELESIDFDLKEIVEKTCDVLAIRAHELGLELICRMSPDVPIHLIGDQGRLRQVLMNLIGNALKFTEEGEIFLQVGIQDSDAPAQGEEEIKLHFSVFDTGIGIPEKKLDLIFDSFTQADSSITRKHGGTGLGLTISKMLVDLMGGKIWVESKEGHGSTFHFTAKFQLQREPKETVKEEPIDLEGLKALIVDDNATNRAILREMVSGWGAVVKEKEDGRRGLEELKRAFDSGNPYDLLLVDSLMPDIDGFKTVEGIRSDLNIPDMTIMMLTSDRRSHDISRCNKLGIACYLVKPVKSLELREAISIAVGKSKAAIGKATVSKPPAPEELPPVHILLVEDTEDNVLLIKSFLKKTPCSLDFAENGQIAVDKFKAGKYNLLFMDMQMPVMDGYTATKQIRDWEKENRLAPTPIVALTAHATKEEAQKSLDAGCNAHLTKPIKKVKLIEAIRDYAASGKHP